MIRVVRNWAETSNYDLRTLSKEFNQETTKRILTETKRMIKWLKQQLKSDA